MFFCTHLSVYRKCSASIFSLFHNYVVDPLNLVLVFENLMHGFLYSALLELIVAEVSVFAFANGFVKNQYQSSSSSPQLS